MSEHNHVVHKDGDINPEQVERAITSIDEDERSRILQSFETFKGYLGKRIKLAQSIGLNEEQIAVIAQEVAEYLADHEDARNSEEKLLKELWKCGSEEEQHHLAHMLVKLARPDGYVH
ncbi:uncharacterized protein DUF3243 [Paenibacillus cellulosilyticus]|uniref:Uncharacterized protein DUF3243 n=1 Tax=Paenibacillus cellulosilyticus TaxID=375489 RepID=A0A2V2YTP9_9BACL|nr:DUF3243 domain-containing protein [Paenibacillus cellulosilyticus]PWV98653.1 uncharacterized protein DUF3243 [Paenibacillus cellulosilyticus]QKS43835.1 DUF3243 domain-containing protein [Paenibacillus cellulosilyticus]